MTSEQLQQFWSRYVPDVLSVFSNPVEGCGWRHEGLGNDPFSCQNALYDQTSEQMASETPHFCAGHVLTVMDFEDAMQAPLVKGIHLGSHCLCLCSIQKDSQDIHRLKAKHGGHGYTRAPDVAIQLCRAVPCDCYPSNQLCFISATTVNQTTEAGK